MKRAYIKSRPESLQSRKTPLSIFYAYINISYAKQYYKTMKYQRIPIRRCYKVMVLPL